ncbi:SDR family oxidoreductase [Novosphingobium kaempferiae]|uniref:SDR family oxidoreductase n=1 Tax=Novosphingobium kaempferiae TaxID=2896849 RepID=UPI001E2BB978|nr:NmrA family NAD(P)-binding protein [Novosphingobium kaempferiae]
MSTPRTILVTSAMGNQGRLLIPRLAEAGCQVRAFDIAADPEALRKLGAAEAIRGDLLDDAALGQAMAGVSAVYHLGPNAHPREDDIGLATIRAAKRAGVRHFVFGSVLHPQIGALSQHAMKLRVSEALLESGLRWTVLAPAHYMQTLQHRAAFAGDPFRLTWSLDRRQALVDLADVTEVAARVLIEGPDTHHAATYELCSGDCLTAWQIAEGLSALLSRDVPVLRVMPEQVIESVIGPDPDPARFAERVRLFGKVADWYSGHDFDGSATVLRALLGREPTSLAQFLKRDLAVWRANVAAETTDA